ncbi:MAG: hypothetical protein M0025_00785 [Elusimicrobia bacterium]|nr:hypothetical protein [Elusimicrobiota bacterium]
MRGLLLALLLPAGAAAQGLGPGADPYRADIRRPFVAAGAGYSDAEGLRHRSARVSGNAVLRPGLTLEAGFSDHRILRDGWLPGELYTADLRLNARTRRYAFSAGVRSSSDRLFYSASETDLSLNAAKVLSAEGRHRLSFGLAYSSRRSFARGYPFPYLLYTYRTETLVFNLPFSALWRPSPDYEVSASYMPPKYCKLGLARRLTAEVKLGAEYSFSALQYDLAHRQDKSASTYIEQRSAGLTADYAPAGDYRLAAWAGWALRGRYYDGRTYDEHRDAVTTRPGPALALNFYRLF